MSDTWECSRVSDFVIFSRFLGVHWARKLTTQWYCQVVVMQLYNSCRAVLLFAPALYSTDVWSNCMCDWAAYPNGVRLFSKPGGDQNKALLHRLKKKIWSFFKLFPPTVTLLHGGHQHGMVGRVGWAWQFSTFPGNTEAGNTFSFFHIGYWRGHFTG